MSCHLCQTLQSILNKPRLHPAQLNAISFLCANKICCRKTLLKKVIRTNLASDMVLIIRQILHVPLVKKFPEIHFESSASVSKCLPNFLFFRSFHHILNAISQSMCAMCSIHLTLSSPIYHPQTLGEETITNFLVAWPTPIQLYFHFHGFILPRQRLVSARVCGLWTTNFHDIPRNTLVGLTERTVLLHFHCCKFVTFRFLSLPPSPDRAKCKKKKNTHTHTQFSRSDIKFMCKVHLYKKKITKESYGKTHQFCNKTYLHNDNGSVSFGWN
jgi:hypothetical protein